MKADPALLDIYSAWETRLRPARRRVWLGAFFCLLVAASLIARRGTAGMRLLAVGLLGGFAVVAIIRMWMSRRRSPQTGVRAQSIVMKVDRGLAAQLGRALELLSPTVVREPRFSVELAELHLWRIVERIPTARLENLAVARASKLGHGATLLILAALGFTLAAPLAMLEGIDVLLASHNVAPLQLQFVELGPAVVQPPAYLHGSPDYVEFDTASEHPRGSLVTVRGVPLRGGPRLVLTDGAHEVPFALDGQGGVTARYALDKTATLRVAARFGRVLIFQNSELTLESMVDHTPEVRLAGAPKHITAVDGSAIELTYEVTDDHGIRQVDLVLRAGPREERRSLIRLDGEARHYVGAHVLEATDAFVSNSYGSVEVSVAARDDNVQDGVKWGQSEAIMIDKPSLGLAQVRRREAYLGLRDQLVDWLNSAYGKGTVAELQSHQQRTLDVLTAIESGAVHDVSTKRIIRSFLRAQRDKLARAARDGSRLTPLLEEVTLSVDSAVEAIAHRDAEQVSRLLADVASEIESGARATSSGEQREAAQLRVRVALGTLGTGAAELKRLGELGADLGEIAQAGWLRIGQALESNDYANVERAASFLAERLRRPAPSFVGGARPGVESQGRGQRRSSRPKASETDSHLDRVAAELQQLVREHASQIESVERIVGDSDRGQGDESLRSAAKQHADELRHIVEGLPALGAEPGSLRASLALAKELVRGAAEALEHLQLAGAYDGLSKADATLTEAELLKDLSALGRDATSPKSLDALRRRLAEHRDWIRARLDESREAALQKVHDQLRQSSAREREFSERAHGLSVRESKSDAVLPDEIKTDLEQSGRLMRQAAESLDSGRGRMALEQQREAQSILERNGLEPEPQRPEPSNQAGKGERRADGGKASGGGKIVSTSDAESREEFRRRVQKGLSREVTPELSNAVRRYAEGLLK